MPRAWYDGWGRTQCRFMESENTPRRTAMCANEGLSAPDLMHIKSPEFLLWLSASILGRDCIWKCLFPLSQQEVRHPLLSSTVPPPLY